MNSQIVTIVLFTLLASCGRQSAKEPIAQEKYFGGEFVYYADAATFTDCATGIRMSVSNDAGYLNAERQYMSLNPDPQEQILIEFIGDIVADTTESGEVRPRVTINRLIGFDRTVSCDPNYSIAGIYEAKMRDSKHILRLKSDYTYTETVFNNSETVQMSSGIWFLSAELELVLEQDVPSYQNQSFEVVPSQSTLAKNSGGEPLVFTKVYL